MGNNSNSADLASRILEERQQQELARRPQHRRRALFQAVLLTISHGAILVSGGHAALPQGLLLIEPPIDQAWQFAAWFGILCVFGAAVVPSDLIGRFLTAAGIACFGVSMVLLHRLLDSLTDDTYWLQTLPFWCIALATLMLSVVKPLHRPHLSK